MKMRTLLSTLSIAIMGMAILTTAGYAQGSGRKMDRRGHHGGGQKIKEALKLTDQQTAQIKALRDKFRQDHASTLQELKGLREQMKEALKAKNKEQAKALREQMKAKMESLKPAREQLRQQIGAILTPEQRETLAKLKAERKEKREDRREKWRDHRKGGAFNDADGNLD